MDELMKLFDEKVVVINVGVQDFGQALEQQEVRVVYVDWTPPAGGDQELIDLLDELL
jgi:hypothetical protein